MKTDRMGSKQEKRGEAPDKTTYMKLKHAR